jgi:hypothetical protein
VLSIIDGLCTKLAQLDICQRESVTNDLIELAVNIIESMGFNSLTQDCLGNLLSKVDLKILLETLPIRAVDIDLATADFDKESNSYILSLLSIYRTRCSFPTFFEFLWNQIGKLQVLLTNQKKIKETSHKDQLVLKRLLSLEAQYLAVLRKSIVFPVKYLDKFNFYLTALLDVFLGFDEQDLGKLSFYGEPIKFLLIALVNQRNSNSQVFTETLRIIKEKGFLAKMCKLNTRLEQSYQFVTDIIKILILMIDQKVAANVVHKNMNRLSTFFQGLNDFQSDSFNRNLRDLDTVAAMLSVFKNVNTFDLYNDLLAFVDTLFVVGNEKVWKRAAILCMTIIQNSHYSFCPTILTKLNDFYQARMKTMSSKKPKDKPVVSDMMAEEKVNKKKTKQRIQGILLKVLKEYVKHYFIPKIEDAENSSSKKVEKIHEELQAFVDIYLPIAIVARKNKSSKARDYSKEFLSELDKAFMRLSSDNKYLTSLVVPLNADPGWFGRQNIPHEEFNDPCSF